MLTYNKNPIFSLNSYFEGIKKHTSHSQEIVTIYEEYEKEFKKRAEIFLDNFPIKIKNALKQKQDHFVYERAIILPHDCFFKLLWNIEKADSIIKRDNIKAKLVPIKELHVDFEEIDKAYLSKAIHNKKPIIATTYEPFENSQYYTFIIDGAHRCAARLNKSLREKNDNPIIKTYILNEKQTLECCCRPVQKSLSTSLLPFILSEYL